MGFIPRLLFILPILYKKSSNPPLQTKQYCDLARHFREVADRYAQEGIAKIRRDREKAFK